MTTTAEPTATTTGEITVKPAQTWLRIALLLLAVNTPVLIAGLFTRNRLTLSTAVALAVAALTCLAIARRKATR